MSDKGIVKRPSDDDLNVDSNKSTQFASTKSVNKSKNSKRKGTDMLSDIPSVSISDDSTKALAFHNDILTLLEVADRDNMNQVF